MSKPTLFNIQVAQKDYLELLLQYEKYVDNDNISIKQVCALLDDVKCFWLERHKIIEFELDELTKSKTCFVLSGAGFLNVADNEHYYFKSLGDYHLLPDPLLKMEIFFRFPEDNINSQFTITYFRRAFFDTLEILTTYKDYFIVLPIHQISVESPEKHRELLDNFFWSIISNAFNSSLQSHEEFCDKYKTFEEIESDLDEFVRSHLIFNGFEDVNLSLREKLDEFGKEQQNISSLISEKSEPQRFLFSVFSYISQIADILYVCLVLRINPYIRFDVTFHYLTLVMYTFAEEKNLREIIEKGLIGYILHRTIDETIFENMDFSEYCKRLENKALLNSILDKTQKLGIDIFQDNPNKLASIITEEFNSIYN
jgi:hypothetical protein